VAENRRARAARDPVTVNELLAVDHARIIRL